MRRLLVVVGWIALLCVTLLGLVALGDGPLGAPPLADPRAWSAWASSRPPLAAVFAVLRLAVLGLGWYLLAVSVIGLVLRLVHLARLVAIADVITVPVVRRLLQGAIGVGLVTAAVTSVGTGRTPPPVSAAAIEMAASPTPAAQIMAPSGGGTALIASPGSTLETSSTPLQPPSTRPWVTRDPDPDPDPTPEHQAETRRWTVSSGEHFWSIAEQVLEEAWRRPVEGHEIVPYWTSLIEANRDVLADPGNPDLVYPGQVFVLPDPPAAAAASS
ncbi:MAG: hypothetical protein GEU81_15080 [Nitriliruptorales bacterium]|nr:hypothetical protein [Nitriliruptorales bacterium]